jgi:hypothetical protein
MVVVVLVIVVMVVVVLLVRVGLMVRVGLVNAVLVRLGFVGIVVRSLVM